MVEWLEANRELQDSSTRQMRGLFSSAIRALRNIKLQDIPLAQNVVDNCTKGRYNVELKDKHNKRRRKEQRREGVAGKE